MTSHERPKKPANSGQPTSSLRGRVAHARARRREVRELRAFRAAHLDALPSETADGPITPWHRPTDPREMELETKWGEYLDVRPARRQEAKKKAGRIALVATVGLGVGAVINAGAWVVTSKHDRPRLNAKTQAPHSPAAAPTPRPEDDIIYGGDRTTDTSVDTSLRTLIFTDKALTLRALPALGICGPDMAAQATYDAKLAAISPNSQARAAFAARALQEEHAASVLGRAHVACPANPDSDAEIKLTVEQIDQRVTVARVAMTQYRMRQWPHDRYNAEGALFYSIQYGDANTAAATLQSYYIQAGDEHLARSPAA